MNKLYEGKSLSSEETEQLFAPIFSGTASESYTASLLTALKMKGESPEEVTGAAKAMIGAAVRFPRTTNEEVGEIVGTGGDNIGSINVSTTAALLAAANGLKIAKHGNRSVSSKTGASDLLEKLGVNIHMDGSQDREALDKTNFAFCFAQVFHPAMRFVMPVRKALATRTIFNILGPLTNPAHPDYAVIGVYSADLILPIAKALKQLGLKRGFVVHGSGMDEVAVHAPTQYARIEDNGNIVQGIFTPKDFGITTRYSLEDIKGGTPEENAQITLDILSGNGTQAQKDIVCANLTLLLLAGKKVDSITEGMKLARESLADGRALKVLQMHREITAANHLATAA